MAVSGSCITAAALRRAFPNATKASRKWSLLHGVPAETARATAEVAADRRESWRVVVYNGSRQARNFLGPSGWMGTRTKRLKKWQSANCSGDCARGLGRVPAVQDWATVSSVWMGDLVASRGIKVVIDSFLASTRFSFFFLCSAFRRTDWV